MRSTTPVSVLEEECGEGGGTGDGEVRPVCRPMQTEVARNQGELRRRLPGAARSTPCRARF